MDSLIKYKVSAACQVDIPEYTSHQQKSGSFDLKEIVKKMVAKMNSKNNKKEIDLKKRRISESIDRSKNRIAKSLEKNIPRPIDQEPELQGFGKAETIRRERGETKNNSLLCEVAGEKSKVEVRRFEKYFKEKEKEKGIEIEIENKKTDSKKEGNCVLPKIVKRESGGFFKKGKLGPLVHSPFRNVNEEKLVRRFSYFHVNNFGVSGSI